MLQYRWWPQSTSLVIVSSEVLLSSLHFLDSTAIWALVQFTKSGLARTLQANRNEHRKKCSLSCSWMSRQTETSTEKSVHCHEHEHEWLNSFFFTPFHMNGYPHSKNRSGSTKWNGYSLSGSYPSWSAQKTINQYVYLVLQSVCNCGPKEAIQVVEGEIWSVESGLNFIVD